MSDRIDEIPEVLREVSSARLAGDVIRQFRARRIAAVKRVSERRGITRETVQDKFGRQLQPDVKTASEFDRLCVAWMQEGSDALHHVLIRHSVDVNDERVVRRFFKHSPSFS